ncbi:hypothetical protein SAMN04515674_11243 [Pseudarcicella hirudinis]|uniref:Uncharacterized protein n=1 Tax=Pseudarcicella hirudinis TaxID=1079859 RepID=A0A1I5WMW2_9BACT|nr:hypothetical protein SAMN04515674_11243 [Pseudarcicella hirudinis]
MQSFYYPIFNRINRMLDLMALIAIQNHSKFEREGLFLHKMNKKLIGS